jgi:hypothetical protein
MRAGSAYVAEEHRSRANGIRLYCKLLMTGMWKKVRKVIAAGANVNLCVRTKLVMAAARRAMDAEHKEIVVLLLDAERISTRRICTVLRFALVNERA